MVDREVSLHTADQVPVDRVELAEADSLRSLMSKILCRHCKRTATNKIRCLGMCVADSDY